jgi:hypothetical protein
MRERVASVLEIVGACSIVVGASLVAAAAGYVVGGLLALLFAWRLTS